ncbi:hypothetical protein COU19_01245 [Candidatus Kaiserbacteria bacterium CG10_big_fil_rev_8_21_14_0_10_56_12]|uniref:Uncharacterized protein n=1 Tax=Candidatus Kaiserbacteria bacterium CG10_big_fil_rev_8_21_14_0_10_56_12 TaxID=1974611 RepID=A0A2H0UA45_9BACT|nr:MAG: hypothetical protein COU19_01245 [Candidatus Kaiserbacteria bacterium CG10_big_fil_rev_8_21_14_0_10_56_12]
MQNNKFYEADPWVLRLGIVGAVVLGVAVALLIPATKMLPVQYCVGGVFAALILAGALDLKSAETRALANEASADLEQILDELLTPQMFHDRMRCLVGRLDGICRQNIQLDGAPTAKAAIWALEDAIREAEVDIASFRQLATFCGVELLPGNVDYLPAAEEEPKSAEPSPSPTHEDQAPEA